MPEKKTPWEQASEWFARTIAIVLVMAAPGAAGAWLDGRLGTSFIAAIGFVLGMILAIGLLMIFARIKPIHNDGEIMKPRTGPGAQAGAQSAGAQLVPGTLSDRAGGAQSTQPSLGRGVKPSEASLPVVPGAEVLEPKRDE